MGMQFRYTCPNCRHWANVAGGGDAGDFINTETIQCEDCQRLYDVTVVNRLQNPPIQRPPLCPKSIWHRVHPWTHPGPCPKCGTLMKQGRETLLWD